MIVLFAFAAVTGAALGYVLFLRPALERRGLVRALSSDVAGWRDRVAIAVRRSATIAWGWLCVLFGTAWGFVLEAADVLGDAEIKTQVTALIPPERVWLAIMAFGVITIIVRLRTARQS